MALDIHIGGSSEEAQNSSVSASFELQPHVLIFERFGLPESKYPFFRRLEDYYKDAKYGSEEVQALLQETMEIQQMFSTNTQISRQLTEITQVCKEAIKLNGGLWVYCD